MEKKKIKKVLKLIKKFEKEHKKIQEFDGEYDSDCQIIEQHISRVATRKKWLGDIKSWKKAKKEEKEMDENIGCLVCDFIKELKESISPPKAKAMGIRNGRTI